MNGLVPGGRGGSAPRTFDEVDDAFQLDPSIEQGFQALKNLRAWSGWRPFLGGVEASGWSDAKRIGRGGARSRESMWGASARGRVERQCWRVERKQHRWFSQCLTTLGECLVAPTLQFVRFSCFFGVEDPLAVI